MVKGMWMIGRVMFASEKFVSRGRKEWLYDV